MPQSPSSDHSRECSARSRKTSQSQSLRYIRYERFLGFLSSIPKKPMVFHSSIKIILLSEILSLF